MPCRRWIAATLSMYSLACRSGSPWTLGFFTDQLLPQPVENEIRKMPIPVLLTQPFFGQEFAKRLIRGQGRNENFSNVISTERQPDGSDITLRVLIGGARDFSEDFLVLSKEIDEASIAESKFPFRR